jgi:hypothetical protein
MPLSKPRGAGVVVGAVKAVFGRAAEDLSDRFVAQRRVLAAAPEGIWGLGAAALTPKSTSTPLFGGTVGACGRLRSCAEIRR